MEPSVVDPNPNLVGNDLLGVSFQTTFSIRHMSSYQDHEARYDEFHYIHQKLYSKVVNACRLKSWKVKTINCKLVR